jgi:predicted phage terminase large subunit-like protein
MATPLAQAFVQIRPDARGFKGEAEREIDKVDGVGAGKKVGSKFGSGFNSSLKRMAAGIGGALLATGVIKFGRDSIAAFSEAQEGQKRLSDAFDRFPALADTNQKALQKLNSALQKKTKYDDDNIASGQAVLAQFGVTGQQLKTVTPLLLDYASRTGKDIPGAAQDVGKALLGNAKALKNIGIKYTATGDTAKDFTNITALLRTQVGGFAQKEGTTAAGQAAILKNQFGEVQETVGSKLVPALMTLTGWLLKTIEFVGRNARILGVLTGVVVTAVAAAKVYSIAQGISAVVTGEAAAATVLQTIALGALKGAQAISTAAQWAWNAAISANPIGLMVIAIAALVAGLIIAWKHSETFRAIVLGALHGIQAGFWATVHAIQTAWSAVYNYVINPILRAAKWVGGKVGDFVGFFKSLPGKIGTVIGGVTDVLTAPFRTAFNRIADLWNGTAGQLHFNVPDWVPGIGGKGFSMPKLPHLAMGTNNWAGGWATINEHGPENVWLPPHAKVLPHGGGVVCTGIGGALTGRSVSVLVLDDPIKDAEAASSPTVRRKTWEWWQSVGSTRLGPKSAVVLIQTRWHEDDLAGRLLAHDPDGWRVISIPAFAESKHDQLGRKIGEPLVEPQGRTRADWLAKKRDVGDYFWAAMYQQRPAPLEGNLFKVNAIRFWHTETELPYHGRETFNLDGERVSIDDTFRFCVADLAASTETSADWTVIGCFAYTHTGQLLLLDMRRERMAPEQHFELAKPLMERWNATLLFVENSFQSSMLALAAGQQGLPISFLKAESNKVTRAMPATARVQRGEFWLPSGAPWLNIVMDELASFPAGRFDDIADVCGYAERVVMTEQPWDFASGGVEMPKGRPDAFERKMDQIFGSIGRDWDRVPM